MEVCCIVRKVTAALHVVILIKYMKNLSNYFLKISLKFLNHYYGNQLTLTKLININGGEEKKIFSIKRKLKLKWVPRGIEPKTSTSC